MIFQGTAGFRVQEARCFALVESDELNPYFLRTTFPKLCDCREKNPPVQVWTITAGHQRRREVCPAAPRGQGALRCEHLDPPPDTAGIVVRGTIGTQHCQSMAWDKGDSRIGGRKLVRVAVAYRCCHHESFGFTPYLNRHVTGVLQSASLARWYAPF